MSYTKELDRIAKVVAEDMLEQLCENIHWSMPNTAGDGDEYMEMHDHIVDRSIHYIKELRKK